MNNQMNQRMVQPQQLKKHLSFSFKSGENSVLSAPRHQQLDRQPAVSIHNTDTPPSPSPLRSEQQMLWRAPWWWAGILPAALARDTTLEREDGKVSRNKQQRRMAVKLKDRMRRNGILDMYQISCYEQKKIIIFYFF